MNKSDLKDGMDRRVGAIGVAIKSLQPPPVGVRVFSEAGIVDEKHVAFGERLTDLDDIRSNSYHYVGQHVIALQHPNGTIEVMFRSDDGISVAGTDPALEASAEADLIGNLMCLYEDAYSLKFEIIGKPFDIILATLKGFIIGYTNDADDAFAITMYAIMELDSDIQDRLLDSLAEYQPIYLED